LAGSIWFATEKPEIDQYRADRQYRAMGSDHCPISSGIFVPTYDRSASHPDLASTETKGQLNSERHKRDKAYHD